MNRTIRQIINKFSYHRGISFGQNLRYELLAKAKSLEQQGKTQEEIIFDLALPHILLNDPTSGGDREADS